LIRWIYRFGEGAWQRGGGVLHPPDSRRNPRLLCDNANPFGNSGGNSGQTEVRDKESERFVKIDLRKIYRFAPMDHTHGDPLPNGGDIYYECTSCNGVISSVPRIPSDCGCGNLTGNGGKATIKEADKVTPVRGKLK
jgi:hypothetical protein